MNLPGPQMPDHMAVRDLITDGPVPDFEDGPQISLDSVGVMAPGDVIFHGHDHLIVTDIELDDRPADAQVHLFNQRTTVPSVVNAGNLAELIDHDGNSMTHVRDIVIPADATYHVEEEAELGLPRQP